MGLWSDHVVPRVTDKMLGNADVRKHRADAVAGLHGVVVEVGFGSGLNVPLYPLEVEHVLAIEPSEVARRLSTGRVAASAVPVSFAGLDGQMLPLDDASADAALSTFTLCTIPDVARALGELHRVLKPGGKFHFLEHGLSPEPHVAQWQHRCNGLEQRLAGGCNLDRPIDTLVRDAGFTINRLEHDVLRGPAFTKPWTYLYKGVATKPR